MFMLGQLVEKRLEVQGEMALGFVDLEKAYKTVLREMVMVTLRWMGVLEAVVRLMEGMHKGTKGRVWGTGGEPAVIDLARADEK